MLFARLLFATIFAAIASLLGYAVKKKLDAASPTNATSEFVVGTAH